jgi:hypothetical protein
MKNILLERFFLILLLLQVCLLSCQGQLRNKYNACTIAKSSKLDYQFIRSNATSILKDNEDKCILLLLDTLTNRTIRTNDRGSLDCLDAFAANSDGYVSEYFLDIGVKLFYEDFRDVILYTFEKNSSNKKPLAKALVEAMSMEISDADDSTTKRQEIDNFVDKQILKYHFTKDQLSYINNLKNRFNPKLFD